MTAAVFRSKYTIPSLPPDFRPRPRLDRLWRDARPARLITVTAGAGWGKTCFLADQARRLAARALWYTLDDLDRDPAVLVDHLAAACGLPVSAAPPLEQLAGIVGRLDRYRLLVLDDVQAIASADAARALLGRILRYLPETCRLVISAREPVALAGARLSARGQASALTASELALTEAESAAFLARRLGRACAAETARRVFGLTEGWPMGLEIVCQALAESPPSDHDAVLQRLIDGGGRWFDFFCEEVLSDLDDQTYRFLLSTSILPHLDPDACNRLTGRRNSAEVLAGLARRGLFTVPVGERIWRYHPLLRGSLRRRFTETMPAGRRRRQQRLAAGLLAAAGEVEAAALDLARSGDPEGAGALLARNARSLTGSQRSETLALAAASLPENLVRRHPALLLVRASLAQMHGRWEETARDLKAAARQSPPPGLAGLLQAHQVRLALQRGRFDACLRAGRQALAQRRALAPADRGVILAAMGVAAASLGRMAEGHRLLQNAMTSADRQGDPVLLGRCLFLLAANIHYIRGDMQEALAAAQRARDIFAGLGRPDFACHAEGVLGFVLAGLGDQKGARESTLWALQRAEAIGYRQIAGYALLTLGECELLAADPAAALARFGEAGAIARELGEDALANWIHLGLAEAAWRLADRKRAARELVRSHELATGRRDRFCLARTLAHQGRLAALRDRNRAQSFWAPAGRLLDRLGARLELSRLRLWQAAAGQGDPAALVAELAASDQAFLVDRLEKALVEEMLGRQASRRGIRQVEGRTAPAAVSPLHVRALGTLEIDRGQAPLIAGPWRSRRARRLFNLLLCSRLRPVPRERALEALWPEADPGKTVGNLRQAVFQLRRLLEPPQAAEPTHVITEGETLRLVLGPDGTCDLMQFEALLEQARLARQAGRPRQERAHLEAALALWRGPYLADTPYDPWVDDTAAGVRHRFLRAAERLLELLAADESWDDLVLLAQRALAEDALHEPFARSLLSGLLRLGRLREARLFYDQFESRLVRELDLLPSPALKDLAESATIRGKRSADEPSASGPPGSIDAANPGRQRGAGRRGPC